jgi:hypothetical protein
MVELTKKQQKRFDYKERGKQLNAIVDEQAQLNGWGKYRRNRDANYIDLDEPFRMGWERNLVWTRSALLRPDIEHLDSVLHLINTRYTSRNGVFRTWDEQNYRYRADFVHGPKSLSQFDYDRLSDRQKAYFDKRWAGVTWGGESYYRFDFVYPRLLESKKSKWFVTRVPRLDPDAQSREQELDNLLYGPKQVMAEYGSTFRSKRQGYSKDWYTTMRAYKRGKQLDREAAQEMADAGY